MLEFISQIPLSKILNFAVPTVIILFSLFLGILFERFIMRRIIAFTNKTEWLWDDVIADSFAGKNKYLFLIAGIYGAIRYFPLKKSILTTIEKMITVLLVIIISLIAAKIAAGLLNLKNKTHQGEHRVISIFTTLTKILILFIGFLIILQFLGLSITPIITALGVGGIAVALALQETLTNIFSGIYIIATRQITVGNYIKIDNDIEGYVRDITWRNTTIETIQNNVIIIPNSKLGSSILTNFSLPFPEMSLYIKVGVAYTMDLEHVEKVTLETARAVMKEVTGSVPTFDPLIRYHTFNDFSIDFTVVLRIEEFSNMYILRHEFIKALHKRYKEEHIEIPFPIRTVHMKQE